MISHYDNINTVLVYCHIYTTVPESPPVKVIPRYSDKDGNFTDITVFFNETVT